MEVEFTPLVGGGRSSTRDHGCHPLPPCDVFVRGSSSCDVDGTIRPDLQRHVVFSPRWSRRLIRSRRTQRSVGGRLGRHPGPGRGVGVLSFDTEPKPGGKTNAWQVGRDRLVRHVAGGLWIQRAREALDRPIVRLPNFARLIGVSSSLTAEVSD